LNEICKFSSETSVSIDHGKETETHTFDRVFEPSSRQIEVFSAIGQPVIDDVLTGYNGTVFAYGQTGSGKTFTMMGTDVYDDEMRGIIPRAASQIFNTVCQQDSELEFTLTCSMLEIYKETLRDLLNPEQIELKIKECPRRGIYVQGLTEVCVVAEDELLEVISLGEQMRTVAATKLNQASSRSHQLFMLDVRQKLPNDTEKKGRLNLIDLAGSEKVNHSGVTGNKLEETKKINLSLSALGNVIHALITNSEHVPYRDSKLTRLLQESLGGNFKTTLIVACSPSPKNIEETLNTIRFAQRAKNIRNKVTVNIKNSPESYIKLIDQLKKDLEGARVEIQMLRERERETSCTEKSSSIQSSPRDFLRQTPRPDRAFRKGKTISSVKQDSNLVLQINEPYIGTSDDSERGKKMNVSLFEPDSLASSFYLSSERAAINESQTSRDSRYIDYEKFLSLKSKFDTEITEKTNRISTLENEKYELQIKLNELELKLNAARKKQLAAEQKSHEYYECYHKTLHLINKDSSENAILKLQNEKLTRQLQRLTQSLQVIEDKFSSFVKDYGKMKNSTQLEFEERSESFVCPVPVITEEESLDVDESDLPISDPKIGIPIDTETLSWSNTYSANVKKYLEPNSALNREITIFHLRNQIIQ
jgi:kinesin family protein 5